MRPRIAPNWQKRRGEYNHDWLKNQYLPALSSWINLLDGRIKDASLERSFIPTILPKWEEKGGAALDLASTFEDEMSPRVLLDAPPLSNLDQETREWLGSLAHTLWLRRYNVDHVISNIITRYKQANQSYLQIKKHVHGISGTESIESILPLRNEFVTFKGLCQLLAQSIEMLPSEVETV